MRERITTGRVRSMTRRLRTCLRTLISVVATLVVNNLTTAAHAQAVLAQVSVTPTSSEFPGGAMVQKMIDWAGQFALWGSLVSLLIGAGIWGVSQQFGNGYQAGKGKILAAAGAVGAVLTGLAAVIVNTLFNAARG